eukprot:CAMPEP_0182868412 /NCGR_PEP_ID=MMETSP0034_2-20130328/9306_1 /TAXON_ID=156128 /ORGANISM="Nephroselmis pyriformis, Strain CCMP717" /LENGTH=135 /DNA_ID=CAMNT_0025000819 /DNA_START=38 /DNA_END=442 /DNA_ORIENTATION=-
MSLAWAVYLAAMCLCSLAVEGFEGRPLPTQFKGVGNHIAKHHTKHKWGKGRTNDRAEGEGKGQAQADLEDQPGQTKKKKKNSKGQTGESTHDRPPIAQHAQHGAKGKGRLRTTATRYKPEDLLVAEGHTLHRHWL